jgi:hypothetical protein
MTSNVSAKTTAHMKIASLALLLLMCGVNCKKNESLETNGVSRIVERWDCGADSGTVWCELDTNNTLKIFGKGAMKDFEDLPPWFLRVKYSSVTRTVIENGVMTIGNGAFRGCFTLRSVTIPNSVVSIGDAAFNGCFDLNSVTISNGVRSIGHHAFVEYLDSVTIPSSVMFIGNNAFKLAVSITVVDNNPKYSSIDGVLFNKDKTRLVQYPASKKDTMYIIPNSVTTIGHGAFSSTGLKYVIIPDSVTSIEDEAFLYGDSLTSITIPSSVTSIGSEAFGNSNIISFICLNPVPPQVNNLTFDNISMAACLYVSAGSRAAYRATDGWNSFGCIKTVKGH